MPTDRIPKNIDSKFRYVLLASHRAEQLMRGANPKIDLQTTKQTRIAMEEVIRESVKWGYGPEPQPEADLDPPPGIDEPVPM